MTGAVVFALLVALPAIMATWIVAWRRGFDAGRRFESAWVLERERYARQEATDGA